MLDCDIPLVAQIDGACIGGGLEIAACCDLRICGRGSRFGIPIARLGFPLAPSEAADRRPRARPATLLRELLLEARLLGADEALARGIVNRVVDDAAWPPRRWPAPRASPRCRRRRSASTSARCASWPTAGRSAGAARTNISAMPIRAEHREGLAAFVRKARGPLLDRRCRTTTST